MHSKTKGVFERPRRSATRLIVSAAAITLVVEIIETQIEKAFPSISQGEYTRLSLSHNRRSGLQGSLRIRTRSRAPDFTATIHLSRTEVNSGSRFSV